MLKFKKFREIINEAIIDDHGAIGRRMRELEAEKLKNMQVTPREYPQAQNAFDKSPHDTWGNIPKRAPNQSPAKFQAPALDKAPTGKSLSPLPPQYQTKTTKKYSTSYLQSISDNANDKEEEYWHYQLDGVEAPDGHFDLAGEKFKLWHAADGSTYVESDIGPLFIFRGVHVGVGDAKKFFDDTN